MGKTSWDIVGVGLQGAGLLPAPSAAGTAPGSGHQQAAPFPFPVFPGAPFVSPNFAAAAAAMRPGAVARPGMPAPPRPGVSARPQLPGPVIQHQFAAPRRNHTGYQEGSAPATAIAKPPASGSHDQPATTPARPMSVNWPVALAPQPNDLAALATKAPNPLSIAALVTPLPPTTDARAVPIVHIGSGSLLPGAPPLTATAHNPVAGPSAAAPRPSVLAPLVTHPQPVTSIQIPAEPAVTVPVANAGRPAPPTAVERVSQPSAPTAPNQPVEQQVYSGAVLFGFSVKGAWLHNNDPNGWLAAKSRLETEESQQAIDQFCRRFNHRVNGRDSSRISAEDMPAFLNEAQRAPELDFWPRATTNATTAPKERETTAANGNPSTSGT